MDPGTPGLSKGSRAVAATDWRLAGGEPAVTVIFAPRLYLVDSNPVTRELLVEYLLDKGFDIVVATDPQAMPPLVDAMIVALDAPPVFAERPRWLAKKPDIPMIVLDRPQLFPGPVASLGFAPDARLSMPVQPRKLVATIRQVLSLARIERADAGEASARAYRFGEWTLDCQTRRLDAIDGAAITLTNANSRC